MNNLIRLTFALIISHLAGAALAQTTTPREVSDPILRLQLSPYTHHFTYDSEHKNVFMVGLEREYPKGKLDGATFFTNSFGQASVYIYPWGGIHHAIAGINPLSFKWTAGLLYGYRGLYENKVPMNYKGFSPGVIVALDYEFKPGWSVQVNALGTAGLMFQLNAPLN